MTVSSFKNNLRGFHMSTKVVDRIEIVAFLYLQKFRNKGFVVDDSRVFFQFDDSPELNEAIYSFLNHKAKVDPYEYNLQVKSILRLSKEIQRGVSEDGK